jgi:hypothetical protein
VAFRIRILAACLLAASSVLVGAASAGAAPRMPAGAGGAPHQAGLADAAVTGSANALVITVALYATAEFPKPVLDASAAQVVHDVVDGTRPWFQHESHGAFGGFFGLGRGPVNVKTTQPACSPQWLQEIGDKADAAAKLHEPALNLSQFNVVVYYFGRVAPCTGEAGWGNTPDQGKRVWLNGDHSARTAVHEFGHHVGLGHAGALQCVTPTGVPVPLSATCTTQEYGDLFSAMGGIAADLPDEYAPSQQAALGWNQAWTTTAVSGSPPSTYFLTPVEDEPAAGTTQSLHLVDNGGESLWLDYHRNSQIRPTTGFDAFTSGLLVRRETNPLAVSPALLFMNREERYDNLGDLFHPNMFVGQSWTNPLGTMTITLNSADATGASVTIQSPPPPPPTDRIVPNLVGQSRGAAVDSINAAGLTVGAVGTRTDPDCFDLDTVSSQSPPGGTHVPPGSTVDYKYFVPPAKGCGTPN